MKALSEDLLKKATSLSLCGVVVSGSLVKKEHSWACALRNSAVDKNKMRSLCGPAYPKESK